MRHDNQSLGRCAVAQHIVRNRAASFWFKPLKWSITSRHRLNEAEAEAIVAASRRLLCGVGW